MTMPIDDFEARYAADPDPWGFATRWYEQRKYALTLAALPAPRYRRAFEPGCSIGVLSAGLAERCDYLLASDGVERVVEAARKRLAGRPNVEVTRLVMPGDWPAGPWDLVVLSEIAYYLDPGDLDRLLARAAETMPTDATLLAVHWRGETNYPQSGDAVHEAIGAHGAFVAHGGYQEARFRLDLYQRR